MISQSAFIIYDVVNTSTNEVVLSGNIGNGQQGATLIKVGTTEHGSFENSYQTVLGEAKKLKGKTVNVFTTIQDIQPDTNKIFYAIEINGGKKIHAQTIINSDVPSHGDIASALVTIIFI